jgi:predicted branched-subunit amino acid permease
MTPPADASPRCAYSSLYFLGDGNWVLSMKAHANGESDAAFVLGSGVAMFVPWVGGTLLGSIANEWVADPKVFGAGAVTAFARKERRSRPRRLR